MQLTTQYFEWSGAVLGLIGAVLLASNTSLSKYGWIAFLMANVVMILFSIKINAWGLCAQQVAFMGTSLFGLYRVRTGFLAGFFKRYSKSLT